MTPADLKKEAGKGPYKGIPRTQIFKRKIVDKRPFTLNNGQKVNGTNWDEKTLTLFVGTRKTYDALEGFADEPTNRLCF
jgi:hypothetical protein